MKKIKSKFHYLWGSFLVFILNCSGVFAQNVPLYGIEQPQTETLPPPPPLDQFPTTLLYGVSPVSESTLLINIFCRIVLPFVLVVVLIVGIAVYIKRRKSSPITNKIGIGAPTIQSKKNDKKNS